MRVAAYYAPPISDPLWRLGSQWLGRDADSGASVVQPNIAGIEEITREARHYGFHATLKPPMRLKPGVSWDAVVTAADDLARAIAPFDLPALEIADLRGFIAIVTPDPGESLRGLCDACVTGLDTFRAPATPEEVARRRRANLSPLQDEMLARWGYPYVFDAWFFHMTLTRRLSADEKSVFLPEIDAIFGETVRAPRRVTDVCLYTQDDEKSPFVLAERLPLRGP